MTEKTTHYRVEDLTCAEYIYRKIKRVSYAILEWNQDKGAYIQVGWTASAQMAYLIAGLLNGTES